jgi:fibronectin type 3 domain-containing protein
VGVVNHPGLVLRDRGVEVGVVYSYHVMAENAKGMSDPSESVDAMTTIRPDAPRDVEATAMEDFVRVTWKGPVFDGASPITSYRVYNVDGEGTALHLGDVNVEGLEGPRLVFLHGVAYDGVSRRYHVTAVNVEGESDPSEDAWTTLFQVPSRPPRPGAEWGDGRVDLEWTMPSDDGGAPVTSYTLFRRVSGVEGFVEMASMPSSSFRYLDDTVANGVEYDYWVTAWNLAGESEPSGAVTVMPAGPPTVPLQVNTEGLNGSVMVRWEEVEWDGGLPVTGYRVFGISDGMKAELLAELDADTREFHHEDLVNGMVYLYAVQAFSMAGNSELSQIAEGRPAGAPSAPQAMIAVWMDGMVYVTWSSPMDDGGAVVTGYRILREDWGAGNWTDVPGLGLMYSDEDVEHNGTYNYSLYAANDVGPGPVVRISFTVPPPEETTDDDAMDIWPWLLVAASVAVLAAAYFYWRRPQAMNYLVEEEE